MSDLKKMVDALIPYTKYFDFYRVLKAMAAEIERLKKDVPTIKFAQEGREIFEQPMVEERSREAGQPKKRWQQRQREKRICETGLAYLAERNKAREACQAILDWEAAENAPPKDWDQMKFIAACRRAFALARAYLAETEGGEKNPKGDPE